MAMRAYFRFFCAELQTKIQSCHFNRNSNSQLARLCFKCLNIDRVTSARAEKILASALKPCISPFCCGARSKVEILQQSGFVLPQHGAVWEADCLYQWYF